MSAIWQEIRQLKILNFDLECRPLSWYGGDFVTKEVTAIGCQWVGDEDSAKCWLLGVDEPAQFLTEFIELYDEADLVTGHYIRGYDLPQINGGCIEFGLPTLNSKLTHDTKLDLVKFSGLSKSQENLGALLKLQSPKVGMNQATWRSANRLEPEGIEKTRQRVLGDVRQNIELRAELLRRGLLTAPKRWDPGTARVASYTP